MIMHIEFNACRAAQLQRVDRECQAAALDACHLLDANPLRWLMFVLSVEQMKRIGYRFIDLTRA
jgi:hypothetical protein